MTVPHHSEPAREAVARAIHLNAITALPDEVWGLLNKLPPEDLRVIFARLADGALSASPAPAAGGLEAVRGLSPGASTYALLRATFDRDPSAKVTLQGECGTEMVAYLENRLIYWQNLARDHHAGSVEATRASENWQTLYAQANGERNEAEARLAALASPAATSGATVHEARVFLKELAARLRNVPCRHIDGWDIDRLLELAFSEPSRVCEVCGGDCSAANPPPLHCPERDGRVSSSSDGSDEVVAALLAEKPFVFDPATNFAHADDGGAPEHGILWAPVERAASTDGEPVAWVIPGADTARDNGAIDAMAWSEGEFTRPLYATPPAAETVALRRYREAVRIDVQMDGPKFMGCDLSALKRAWDADRRTGEKP